MQLPPLDFLKGKGCLLLNGGLVTSLAHVTFKVIQGPWKPQRTYKLINIHYRSLASDTVSEIKRLNFGINRAIFIPPVLEAPVGGDPVRIL